MKYKKILIVGGLHGDEPTGISVVKYFLEHPQKGITALLGNRKALDKKKRFLETDLNRSFTPAVPVSHEELRAKVIKKQLPFFDLIIDIHNTRGENTTCVITTMLPTKEHTIITSYFGFSKLVVMPPSGSLISQYPAKSISLEIAFNERSKYSVKYFVNKIINLISHDVLEKEEKLHIYTYVQPIKCATLERVNITPTDIHNFLALTPQHLKLLHLPLEKKYYPIFSKKKFDRDTAFDIVEANTTPLL